jgi:hypothetical protein
MGAISFNQDGNKKVDKPMEGSKGKQATSSVRKNIQQASSD